MGDISPTANHNQGNNQPEEAHTWLSASDAVLPSVEEDFTALLNIPSEVNDDGKIDPMLSMESFDCKYLQLSPRN
jgi:hypothetical protein